MKPSRLLRALLLSLALCSSLPQAWAYLPDLVLAEVYRGQQDVSAFLVSEKLDGVRAYWDGKSLRSRSGKAIQAPEWFIAGLPAHPLDGELWMGRGSFEKLSAAVRRDIPIDAEWRQVRYMIFELPGVSGSFADRVARIKEIVSVAGLTWLQAIDQFYVADQALLQKRLAEVVKAGGEGLMLHRADALYQTGRSDTLLKMKPWDDAEAEVIGYRPGKGRFAGRMGALQVRTPEGKEFLLGTGFSENLRSNPPEMGIFITYRYQGFTHNGLPRFARFMRIRGD